MSKLQLYLKGSFFQEMDIQLPPHDDNLDFTTNCEIREEYVRHLVKVMTLQCTRAIFNSGFDYQFYLVAESVLGRFEPEGMS